MSDSFITGLICHLYVQLPVSLYFIYYIGVLDVRFSSQEWKWIDDLSYVSLGYSSASVNRILPLYGPFEETRSNAYSKQDD